MARNAACQCRCDAVTHLHGVAVDRYAAGWIDLVFGLTEGWWAVDRDGITLQIPKLYNDILLCTHIRYIQ